MRRSRLRLPQGKALASCARRERTRILLTKLKYTSGLLPGNANASEQQSATSQDSLFTKRAARRLVAVVAIAQIRWRSFCWTFSDQLTSLLELCHSLS